MAEVKIKFILIIKNKLHQEKKLYDRAIKITNTGTKYLDSKIIVAQKTSWYYSQTQIQPA